MNVHRVTVGDTTVHGIFLSKINGAPTAPDAVPTVVAGSEKINGVAVGASVITPSINGTAIEYVIDSTAFVDGDSYTVQLEWDHAPATGIGFSISVDTEAAAQAATIYSIG